MDPARSIPTSGWLGPPRPVPPAVRARVLFGGALSQFGWIFFGFGMIFVWLFVPLADFSALTFRGELATAQGTVSAVERTRASEGGNKHSSGTPVYANHYVFEHGGQEHRGVSYTTGDRVDAGRSVTVEFPRAEPGTSRIRGQRANVFAPWVAFVVLFPTVGVVLASFGFRRGLKGGRLLARGLLSEGVLVNKRPTGASVNDRPVYELRFEFRTLDGRVCEATAKSHRPELLEDEASEPLLYDPTNPEEAVLLDGLPGSPRIDAAGAIRLEHPGSAVAVVLVPLLSAVGHGLYLVSLLG